MKVLSDDEEAALRIGLPATHTCVTNVTSKFGRKVALRTPKNQGTITYLGASDSLYEGCTCRHDMDGTW